MGRIDQIKCLFKFYIVVDIIVEEHSFIYCVLPLRAKKKKMRLHPVKWLDFLFQNLCSAIKCLIYSTC